MAHKRIACGCFAYFWGMAVPQEDAGQISIYSELLLLLCFNLLLRNLFYSLGRLPCKVIF